MSDEEHDTEPSPPPSGNVTVIIPEGDPVDALCERIELRTEDSPSAAVVPFPDVAAEPHGLAPSPGESARFSYRVDDGGNVVPGAFNPAREWYDYGKDTGPRLRVKRILEGQELADEMARTANAPPQVTDRDEERAIHAESEKAFREKDDKKLGKIYEDLLDEIHSPELGERKAADAWFDRAFTELEAALTAEIRELCRQERRWDWGYRVTKDGLSIRAVPRAGGDVLECRVDKKALRVRIHHAATDAKDSAAIIVRTARDHFAQARAALIVVGPSAIPYEPDAGRA